MASKPMSHRYTAAMVLAGVGDALGYNKGTWEFNQSGPQIHKEVKKLGGLPKIKVQKPEFLVSDDTVMHLATARALIKSEGLDDEELFSNLAQEYIECMNDMADRAPGNTCMSSCHRLQIAREKEPMAYRVPFNSRGGGCGAAMRAMCIGLRYGRPDQLQQLIAVSIESGRITHHHPTGYLGGLVSALFTSYAIQDKPVKSWGLILISEVLPLAREYVKMAGVDVENNLHAWNYFENHWRNYLALRKIESGERDAVFPKDYDVEARDAFYSSISYSGWGGSAGHDSTIIAYDALLASGKNWDQLCSYGTFHGGDNDSTGTIASCWFGALYGLDGVYERNHKNVEYREKMVEVADRLYEISQATTDKPN